MMILVSGHVGSSDGSSCKAIIVQTPFIGGAIEQEKHYNHIHKSVSWISTVSKLEGTQIADLPAGEGIGNPCWILMSLATLYGTNMAQTIYLK